MKKFITPVVSFVRKQSKRTKILALGAFIVLLVPAVAFGLHQSARPAPEPAAVQQPEDTKQAVAAETTTAQPTDTPVQPTPQQPAPQAKTVKPAAPVPKPAVASTPTLRPGVEVIRPLIVGQSTIQLQVGQMSSFVSASSGSSTAISYINIDFSASTPGIENHVNVKYDGGGWSPNQAFRLIASPSAAPGTYSMRLTTSTETETMNSKNPVFYRTTITVIIVP